MLFLVLGATPPLLSVPVTPSSRIFDSQSVAPAPSVPINPSSSLVLEAVSSTSATRDGPEFLGTDEPSPETQAPVVDAFSLGVARRDLQTIRDDRVFLAAPSEGERSCPPPHQEEERSRKVWSCHVRRRLPNFQHSCLALLRLVTNFRFRVLPKKPRLPLQVLLQESVVV